MLWFVISVTLKVLVHTYLLLFAGCVSWKWFYPFHYAPFASDFVDLEDIDNSFPTTTVPKKPLEQLMCVFPAASGQFLPPSWQSLMSEPVNHVFRISCCPSFLVSFTRLSFAFCKINKFLT